MGEQIVVISGKHERALRNAADAMSFGEVHDAILAALAVVRAARALEEATSCVTPTAGICENETHHLDPQDRCVEDGIFLALSQFDKTTEKQS